MSRYLFESSVLCVGLWTPWLLHCETFLHADPKLWWGLQMGLSVWARDCRIGGGCKGTGEMGQREIADGSLAAEACLMCLHGAARRRSHRVLDCSLGRRGDRHDDFLPTACLQETVAPAFLGRVFALSRSSKHRDSFSDGAAIGLQAVLSPQLCLMTAAIVYLIFSSVYRSSGRGVVCANP